MPNNQIVVLIIVVVVVIILVLLFWGWWSSSSSSTVNDATYKELLILRSLMDDKRVFTREHSRNLALGSPCLDSTTKVFTDTNAGIAAILLGKNAECSKVSSLTDLLNAQALFLKRLNDGEDASVVTSDAEKNTAAIVALLTNKPEGDSKLSGALNNYNLLTFSQFKNLATGECNKSIEDYKALKKSTLDIYDLLYAYVITNRQGR